MAAPVIPEMQRLRNNMDGLLSLNDLGKDEKAWQYMQLQNRFLTYKHQLNFIPEATKWAEPQNKKQISTTENLPAVPTPELATVPATPVQAPDPQVITSMATSTPLPPSPPPSILTPPPTVEMSPPKKQSFTWTRRPYKRTVVVEGVDNSRVSLNWEFTASAQDYTVSLSRQSPGETEQTLIAYRLLNTAFNYADQSFKQRYEAKLPATLVLKDVKQNDEYVYTIKISSAGGQELLSDQVTIGVVVPPKITIAPVREPQLSIGQNYTLKCNASGDPHPNITWTKDGVPVNQFNVSGYLLHLVKVQRKDAGSYRCTASNGYGSDATSVSIVGIKCTSFGCEVKKVAIRLRSEDWKPAHSNQASAEYKTLESKLLSAIWSVYTKNPAKQLHIVDVDNFRSGSVIAIVELLFGKSATSPLKPLQDEIKDGKLGPFMVDPELDLNPTIMPLTSSNMPFTSSNKSNHRF
ncbi:hypothetical protein ACROYT_G028401 [Oculina patagonica]